MYNLLFKIIKVIFVLFLSFDRIDYVMVVRSENDLATESAGIPDTANKHFKDMFFVPKGKPLKM